MLRCTTVQVLKLHYSTVLGSEIQDSEVYYTILKGSAHQQGQVNYTMIQSSALCSSAEAGSNALSRAIQYSTVQCGAFNNVEVQ